MGESVFWVWTKIFNKNKQEPNNGPCGQITWELSKPTQHSDLCSLVISLHVDLSTVYWELSKPTQHSDLCSLVIYSQTVYTPTSQDRPLKLLVNKSTVTFVSNFVISKKQMRLLLYNELGVFITTLDKY